MFDTYDQFSEAFAQLSTDSKFWLEALIDNKMNRSKAAAKLGRPMSELTLLLNTDLVLRVMYNYYAEAIQATQDDIKQLLTDHAMSNYLAYLKKEDYFVRDKFGEIHTYKYWTIDIEALEADGKGHLVKKISYDKEGRMSVEFHDSQKAAQMLMNALGMNKAPQQAALPHGFDMSQLNQDQLGRLANNVSTPFEVWREVEFAQMVAAGQATKHKQTPEGDVFDLTRFN